MTAVSLPGARRTLLSVGIVMLVLLAQLAAGYVSNRDATRFVSVLLFYCLELLPLMVALSAVFRWTRRTGRGWGWVVGIGAAVAATIGVSAGALFYWLSEQVVPQLDLHLYTSGHSSLGRAMVFGFVQAQSHLGLWTLAFAVPFSLEDAQVRRAEADGLRSSTELARLRANLEPHFLLNTLNAIAGLVTEDAREARRLLAALGDLLRDALKDEDELQSLSAQVTWLKRYAEILEARHRGDLSFRWEIDDHARDVPLPRLLLQPLVENAVKHGALKARGAGEVQIRAVISDDGQSLVCTVRDNGPGTGDKPIRKGAFGLQSVERRIALRYGARGRVVLESSDSGATSTVVLPRHPPQPEVRA
ncbi:MAG: histidine kinase [Archangiaceae bacterium]|nr:histidine kinase [Archangiaceae bacterium]